MKRILCLQSRCTLKYLIYYIAMIYVITLSCKTVHVFCMEDKSLISNSMELIYKTLSFSISASTAAATAAVTPVILRYKRDNPPNRYRAATPPPTTILTWQNQQYHYDAQWQTKSAHTFHTKPPAIVNSSKSLSSTHNHNHNNRNSLEIS